MNCLTTYDKNAGIKRVAKKLAISEEEAAIEEESQVQVMMLHIARKTSTMSILEVNFYSVLHWSCVDDHANGPENQHGIWDNISQILALSSDKITLSRIERFCQSNHEGL